MPDRLNISRRDFLGGVALGVAAGSSLTPLELLAQSGPGTAHYPPGLMGLRGSHVGSFEIAHAVALGGAKYGKPRQQTDATYDLVVVGGGISGLAAALLFQQQHGGGKRVLVLDNHDDFGGHAKRNEFDVDGERLITYGGSQSLESPGRYSRESAKLIRDIGIDTDAFYDYFDREYFSSRGLRPAIYFSQAAYGADLTLPNVMGDFTGEADASILKAVLARYPISAASKAKLEELLTLEKDYLAGKRRAEKRELLRSISYTEFLRDYAGAPEELITILRDRINGYWGFGLDALSALEGWRLEQPGTAALGLGDGAGPWSAEEPYIFHFPDGNAGIARAIVRALIPGSLPGGSMEELTIGKVDYGVLDHADNATRIRLNATGVDVRHTPDQAQVDVTYIRAGKPERVRARHVIMACYNSVVPYIVPEVPAAQRQAIEQAWKTPLVYVNVAVRNWKAMAELGCNSIYIPQAELMYAFGLDFPVSIGRYRYTRSPDQPTVLHGNFVPTTPGLTQKEQNTLGRRRVLEMSYDDFEQGTLAQLDGALGNAGFDVERDLAGITVNRWPHGYAYEYNELYDAPDLGPENGPHIAGRAQIGRISIANSDSSAYAYVDGAIDAAYRAVAEQLDL